MIAKLVSFQLPADMNRDEVMAAAHEAAEDGLNTQSLLEKTFCWMKTIQPMATICFQIAKVQKKPMISLFLNS